jgi:hypothetical protein
MEPTKYQQVKEHLSRYAYAYETGALLAAGVFMGRKSVKPAPISTKSMSALLATFDYINEGYQNTGNQVVDEAFTAGAHFAADKFYSTLQSLKK